jgi:hypothetical protein
MTRLRTGQTGESVFDSWQEQEVSSAPRSVMNGTKNNPAFCPMGTGSYF